MFSFNPLPIIDTLNDHVGFWMICIMMTIIVIYNIFYSIDDGEYTPFVVAALFAAATIGISAYVSWNSGDIIRPKNEKVIGTLVNYFAEGGTYTQQSGKTTIRRENHYLYVIYRIEGYGNVSFKATPGIAYPQTAIIYKN